MRRLQIGRLLIPGLLALLFILLSGEAAAAWQGENPAAEATATPSAPYITVLYEEGARVRSGPNALDYPPIGWLQHGETALAVGRSPGGEWILIVYPPSPTGVGWVYAPLVSLSPGLLPIVEPPPTPTRLGGFTLNPTFVAAYQNTPTPTRLPTFTPPPPLTIPVFTKAVENSAPRFPIGAVVLALGLTGGLGWIVSLFRRQ